MWFLKQYEELFHLEKEISKYSVATLPKELLLEAKQKDMERSSNCTYDGLFGKSSS